MTEKRQRGDDDHGRLQRPCGVDRAHYVRRDASVALIFVVPHVHELSRQDRASVSKVLHPYTFRGVLFLFTVIMLLYQLQPQEIAYYSKYADDARFDRSNLVCWISFASIIA
jgi:hypothetical protein